MAQPSENTVNAATTQKPNTNEGSPLAVQERYDSNPFQPGTQDYARWEQGIREFPPEDPQFTTPVEDYIAETHLYIEAQTAMIHGKDVPAFATAQERYIRAQNVYIGVMLGKK